jgi:hypothetical protein
MADLDRSGRPARGARRPDHHLWPAANDGPLRPGGNLLCKGLRVTPARAIAGTTVYVSPPMPDPPTYPGVYSREEPEEARTITGVASAAALFDWSGTLAGPHSPAPASSGTSSPASRYTPRAIIRA